jgi:2-polyprenyl-6-methoxyphenol hydroxylase-like FAD-dependent oxidoreductase
MTSDLPFLIAGGGIAGLAVALGLSRAGQSVRLFEQASAFEEVGAGLQMSPNGVRALKALGAWDAVEPNCVIPSEIHIRDGISGAHLQRIRLGQPFEAQFGAPYRVCHRADLLAGLLASAQARAGIELNTAARVLSATTGTDHAELELSDAKPVTGRAIIAADGIRSTLRRQVCGAVEPVFRGHAIYRALIPLKSVPQEIEADCVTLWLCPGGHVVHYPVSNWRNFNIVAALDVSSGGNGWGEPAPSREVLQGFQQVNDDLQAMLSEPTSWLRWRAADLPELPAWSKENLLLVGDAAHATLPYLAQGAVMALEDAATLSGLITGGYDSGTFAQFAAQRQRRTSRIQSESHKLGRIYHARSLTALARNTALRLGGSGLMQRKTEWIYNWRPE